MIRSAALAILAVALSACGILDYRRPVPEPQVAKDPVPPIASDEFVLSAPDEVLGRLQVVRARHEDTFPDLARRYNLGYDELRLANSTVDPWVPGEGTSVLLPTQFILPDTPRQGVVLNLAAMRLFYFPDTGQSELPRVLTHPVGIGRLEWPTPTGSTAVVSKARDPVWYVPRSIRREHAAAGDPLPSQVPPGPDNPLGEYVLQLGMPGYLIHGTNKPYGVGMRVSHGCVRLYPEDIEPLFRMVPIGTPVHIVNQPYLAGWLAGTLYLEAHEPMEGDEREWGTHLEPLLAATLERAEGAEVTVDWERVAEVVREARGIPEPISVGSPAPAPIPSTALVVENTLPAGVNLKADPVPLLQQGETDRLWEPD